MTTAADLSLLSETLNHWALLPPVLRRKCSCGRAYVLNPVPGEPCDLCKSELSAGVCFECGGTGWLWKENAVCYANEWEGQTSCWACSPPYDRD